MKVLERIVDRLIKQLVCFVDSKFGFVPGRHKRCNLCTQAAEEKYLAANKRLYMVFLDLAKVFDGVPRKVIWWALRIFGVEEGIVQLVQGSMPMSGAMSVWVRGTMKRLK